MARLWARNARGGRLGVAYGVRAPPFGRAGRIPAPSRDARLCVPPTSSTRQPARPARSGQGRPRLAWHGMAGRPRTRTNTPKPWHTSWRGRTATSTSSASRLGARRASRSKQAADIVNELKEGPFRTKSCVDGRDARQAKLLELWLEPLVDGAAATTFKAYPPRYTPTMSKFIHVGEVELDNARASSCGAGSGDGRPSSSRICFVTSPSTRTTAQNTAEPEDLRLLAKTVPERCCFYVNPAKLTLICNELEERCKEALQHAEEL
jgi:hypothetical protein